MIDAFADRLTAAHTNADMVGWDFSRLDGRMTAGCPGWDFDQMCLDALVNATSALDMGTGGGERLLKLNALLRPHRTSRLTATEGWAPNLDVARNALAPCGIELTRYDSEHDRQMPMQDESFDLVTARHESYAAEEVARVLRAGGIFLTQQVHGQDVPELYDWFGGESSYPHVTLERALDEARTAGLVTEGYEEWSGPMQFCDTEALVEYLGLTPWVLPDFTVAAHLDTLERLEAAGPVTLTQRRFRLTARLPTRQA